MIVIDASIVVSALAGNGELAQQARQRLSAEPLAPELVGVEVVSALRSMAATGRIEPWQAALAVADFVDLPLMLVPHRPLLRRCWQLRNNVSAYDATYIALAEIMDATLVTRDRRLASATGIRCEVELLGL